MMGPQFYWWDHAMWVFPIIFLVFALVGITVFLFVCSRGFCGPWARRSDKGYRNESESPLDILKKRYAKGEVAKAEFEQIKNDLSK